MKKIFLFVYIFTASILIATSCTEEDFTEDRGIMKVRKADNFYWIDISSDSYRHIIIAQGTVNLYNGHPTSVMLDDNKTIFCTWSKGHGGSQAFLSVSHDTGLTWESLSVPSDWYQAKNCPSIYKLIDKLGIQRLMIFSGEPNMSQTYSMDNGKTWSPIKSLNKPCVMAFSSIIELKNGDYLGLYHKKIDDQPDSLSEIWQSVSSDGGLTWSESIMIGKMVNRSPSEPYVFRSPDNTRLVCIARENKRIGASLMMYSDDEGQTWSNMEETNILLTGDRHVAKYTSDGQLVIAFRDMGTNSPTKNHFVAWVGSYQDVINKRPGKYKVKLLHSYKNHDCGYPGLEILPDGTIVSITYIKYKDDTNQNSIVETRFKLSEINEIIENDFHN